MTQARTDLRREIRELRNDRNAVILAHNYQHPDVQDAADFVGDSLELSRKAATTRADVVVFCGVRFMAETAAILNPARTILLPDAEAGCPMADMIRAEELEALKAKHPGAPVICYVNSSAEVKAASDCCCTSANAVAVVNSFAPAPVLLFVPDQHLGDYVSRATGRPLVLWPGYCPTHVRIRPEAVQRRKESFPDARVLVHPECPEPVRALADAVLSTGGMCRDAAQSPAAEFIVATESELLHRLRKENPGKRFYPADERAVCPNMKKITLPKVLRALQELKPEIRVPAAVADPTRAAIERMLAISAGAGAAATGGRAAAG